MERNIFQDRITDFEAKQDDPREKGKRYGHDVLTDSELLSIIIGRQVEGLSIRKLRQMSITELMYCGFTEAQAQKTVACAEISRRMQKAPDNSPIIMQQPDKVYEYFGPMMRDLRKEVFYVAYLNSAKELKGYKKISVGGTNATIVDPPEVLREAIMNHAHGIILLHNHPSGNTNPSRADINLTQRLLDGGKMIGIQVLDHIIVAGYDYTSFKSRGIIP